MYDNIAEAAAILEAKAPVTAVFSLSVYPSSMPVNLELLKDGIQQRLLESGALFKSCLLAGRASAPETYRPTMAFPSATPPGTFRTARAPSPARASLPPSC
jgi:hypothetical protein